MPLRGPLEHFGHKNGGDCKVRQREPSSQSLLRNRQGPVQGRDGREAQTLDDSGLPSAHYQDL